MGAVKTLVSRLLQNENAIFALSEDACAPCSIPIAQRAKLTLTRNLIVIG